MAKEHVHGVFQSVADQYDAANDRISLGMHHHWKKGLIDQVALALPEDGGMVLDVCCGTGDITELIANAHPGTLAVGLDFSSEMLKVAAERTKGMQNVMLVEGNAMELPFDDNTFDAAVISFGLRNTPDYEQVISEMVRVVKPGGIVACLDASVPENKVVYPFYTAYYKGAMPYLGGGIKKHKEYVWLYQSTQDFLSKDELAALFMQCGLRKVSVKSYMCGASALHVGTKPNDIVIQPAVAQSGTQVQPAEEQSVADAAAETAAE